jgi:hypothetical protein
MRSVQSLAVLFFAFVGQLLAACPDPLGVATFELGDTGVYSGLFSRDRLSTQFSPRVPLSRSQFGTGRDGFSAFVSFEGNSSLDECLWETGGLAVGSWIGLRGDMLRLRAGNGQRLFGAETAPGVAKCEADVSHLRGGGVHLLEWFIDAPRGVVAMWVDGRELCRDTAIGALGMPPLLTPAYSGRDPSKYGNCVGSAVPNGEVVGVYLGALSTLSFYNDVHADENRPPVHAGNVSRVGLAAGLLEEESLLGPFHRGAQSGFVLDLWVMFTAFSRGNNTFAALEYVVRSDDLGPVFYKHAVGVFVNAAGRVAISDSYSRSNSEFSGRLPVDSWVRVTVAEREGFLHLYLNRLETGSCPGPAFEPQEFLVRVGRVGGSVVTGYVDDVAFYGSGAGDLDGLWMRQCEEAPPPDAPSNGSALPHTTSAPFTTPPETAV